MTDGSDYGFSALGPRFGDQGGASAPDFVRGDRGDVDDHWSRVLGRACGKCAAELTDRDFVRRRPDGTWIHERCPQGMSARDSDADPETDEPPTPTEQ